MEQVFQTLVKDVGLSFQEVGDLTPYQVKRILFREDQATPLPLSSPDQPVFPLGR